MLQRNWRVAVICLAVLAVAGVASANNLFLNVSYLEFGRDAVPDIRRAMSNADDLSAVVAKKGKEASPVCVFAFGGRDNTEVNRSGRWQGNTYEVSLKMGAMQGKRVPADIRWVLNEEVATTMPLGNGQQSVSKSTVPSGLTTKTDLEVGRKQVIDVVLFVDRARILFVETLDRGPSSEANQQRPHGSFELRK